LETDFGETREEEKVRCLPTKEKEKQQMGEGGDKWG